MNVLYNGKSYIVGGLKANGQNDQVLEFVLNSMLLSSQQSNSLLSKRRLGSAQIIYENNNYYLWAIGGMSQDFALESERAVLTNNTYTDTPFIPNQLNWIQDYTILPTQIGGAASASIIDILNGETTVYLFGGLENNGYSFDIYKWNS
eukprot:316867_1